MVEALVQVATAMVEALVQVAATMVEALVKVATDMVEALVKVAATMVIQPGSVKALTTVLLELTLVPMAQDLAATLGSETKRKNF